MVDARDSTQQRSKDFGLSIGVVAARVRSRSGRAGVGNRAGRQETVGPNNECPANEEGSALPME